MIIHRSNPESQFVIIPNETLRDRRLSYQARGILAELLTRSDEWSASADTIWRRAKSERGSAGEGRAVIRRAFAELETVGYLHRHRHQLEGGQFVTDLHLFDAPDGLAAWLAASDFRAMVGEVASTADVSPGRTDDRTGGARSGQGKPASSQVVPTYRRPVVGEPVVGEPVVGRPAVGQPVVYTKTHYEHPHEDRSTKIDDEDPYDEHFEGPEVRGTQEGNPATSGQDHDSSRANPPEAGPVCRDTHGRHPEISDEQNTADRLLLNRFPAEQQEQLLAVAVRQLGVRAPTRELVHAAAVNAGAR